MAHGKYFYLSVLLFILPVASVVYAADESSLTVQSSYEAYSQEHMQIVNEQMDQLEGNPKKPAIEQAPPKESLANDVIQPKEVKKFQEEIIGTGFYATAGYDMNYMHYSEWSGLIKEDEDYGKQNGEYYAAGYRARKPVAIDDWVLGEPFVEVYDEERRGDIKYKGALQSTDPSDPGTVPYNSEQNSKIYQTGVKLGGYTNFSSKGEAYAYGDFGKRIWYRGQDEGYDYREKYYWKYGGGGVGINYHLTSRLLLGLEGELLFALNPRMYADLIDSDFKLGPTWEGELKAPIKFFLLKNLSLDITPYFKYLRISPSAFIPYSNTGYGFYEPDSKTHDEGLIGAMTLYI